MKPFEVIIVPAMVGFADPTFDIMKPDVGPNNNIIIANGNSIFAAFTAFPANPSGSGDLTSIGIV
jgi:hypothetical protein